MSEEKLRRVARLAFRAGWKAGEDWTLWEQRDARSETEPPHLEEAVNDYIESEGWKPDGE